MSEKLFLSYSRRQTIFMDDLHASLEQKGLDCWLDYLHIQPGKPWQAQIDADISISAVILL